MPYTPIYEQTPVVGNDYKADGSMGFKSEVSSVLSNFARGGSLSTAMESILMNQTVREQFLDSVMESITTSPIFTDEKCLNSPFYDNYADRLRQLEENSMNAAAVESIVTSYSPIVAYNPFFLKKQWISTVFKDVLMTEVPPTPIINYAVEKRFLRTMDGTEYPIPDIFYDPNITRALRGACTGTAIKEEPIEISKLRGLPLIDPQYIPGVIKGDANTELTQDITICAVTLTDGTVVPCNIRTNATTNQWDKGRITYKKTDAFGNVTQVITDNLFGAVDFVKGTVTVVSEENNVTHVTLRGKIANRWNDRSITTVRRVEPVQFVMPESGEHLNAPITLEDAAHAIATQNVDIIADNVDTMGRTLAEFEDFEIRDYLDQSYDAQMNAGSMATTFLDSNSLIVNGSFDALPYEGFTNNVTDWMKDSREYFERILAGLKTKLKSEDVVVICYAHPNLVRYLANGINWVFTDEVQISGMKLSYNFGIYTGSQDRVHIITSMYCPEDSGLHFVVIPTTNELITYKHFKYNAVIDRNYRDPVHPLTPNVMITQSTLTAEILPVQGRLAIYNRDAHSPTTLKRVTSENTAAAILGAAYSDAGIKGVASKNAYGYVVTATGTAKAGSDSVNKNLYGTLTGNHAEMIMQLPGIAPGGSYVIKQTNPALESFETDADVKKDGEVWVKTKVYTYEQICDGYSFLLSDKAGDIRIQIFNASNYIDGASPAITMVTVNNNVTFA